MDVTDFHPVQFNKQSFFSGLSAEGRLEELFPSGFDHDHYLADAAGPAPSASRRACQVSFHFELEIV